MTSSAWLRGRSRPTRAFFALVVILAVFTIAGGILVGDSTSRAADVAWIVQMGLLAACLVSGGLAVAAALRGRTARRRAAR